MASYSKEDSILILWLKCSTKPECNALLPNEKILNATILKTYVLYVYISADNLKRSTKLSMKTFC